MPAIGRAAFERYTRLDREALGLERSLAKAGGDVPRRPRARLREEEERLRRREEEEERLAETRRLSLELELKCAQALHGAREAREVGGALIVGIVGAPNSGTEGVARALMALLASVSRGMRRPAPRMLHVGVDDVLCHRHTWWCVARRRLLP